MRDRFQARQVVFDDHLHFRGRRMVVRDYFLKRRRGRMQLAGDPSKRSPMVCQRSVQVNLPVALMLLCLGLSLTSAACAQDVQFGTSEVAQDTFIWQASHTGFLGCRDDCAECRAFRQRCQTYRRGGVVCPPGGYQTTAPEAERVEPSPDVEGLTTPAIEPVLDVSDLGQLSGSFGASGGVLSAAPGMIGDSFGGAVIIDFPISDVVFPTPVTTVVPNGGAARLVKISQHNSPLPRCRVFFDYNHFHNASQGNDENGGMRDFDANRYVFGWEKCMLDNLMSVELRVPFSRMLSSDQVGFLGSVEHTEFGNLNMAVKILLKETAASGLSAGLGVNFPTADDFRLFDPFTGAPELELKDESVHLSPFVGWLWRPSDRIFTQSFLQFDFDAGGNDFIENGVKMGTYNDQSLMFVDASLGYWLYRNRSACYVTGIAGLIELHYTTTLQDTDAVATNRARVIANPFNRIDVLNMTGGVVINLTELSSLRVAAATPLRNKHQRFGDLDFASRFFDAELLVQLERRY